VLVVEDDDDTAAFFRDALNDFGYEPVLVRSAEAARLALATERVDAVLLDVRLPLMSGIDFLRLGLGREAGIPIVVVSGATTEREAVECLWRGALDFLPKPVSLDLLRAVLRYAEVFTPSAWPEAGGRPADRRRSARVAVTIPVRVVEYSGTEWQGTCVELSAFGVKLRPDGSVAPPGTAVRLGFALPDGGPPLDRLAVLVRHEPDGYIFRFVNLTEVEFDRLRETVTRLAAEPS
jgi:CheY-like chemotaxis protein